MGGLVSNQGRRRIQRQFRAVVGRQAESQSFRARPPGAHPKIGEGIATAKIKQLLAVLAATFPGDPSLQGYIRQP